LVCSPSKIASNISGRFVQGSTKKALALFLSFVILAAALVAISLTLARAAGVNSPEILASYTPSSLDANVYYNIIAKVRDNDNLLDVNQVILNLYENSLNQGASDNVQNHYTFNWVRGAGFNEVGPGPGNEHLDVNACTPGSYSVTTDNWTFRIRLDVTALPGQWNLWVKVVDNANQQENLVFANKFTVNPYGQVPSVNSESRLPFLENEVVKDNLPVLTPSASGFDNYAVYNPAVVHRDNTFYMFYRAQSSSGGISEIGMATSTDGENFQKDNTPAIVPTENSESNGCEDPRVVEIDGTYWMTYTAYNGSVARLALATSENLENWIKVGLAFPGTGWSKSGAIVPEKINGKYYMYYEGSSGGGDLYYATSDNLYTWTSGGIVMERRKGYFDALTIEPGPTPIILDNGILLIYNSLNKQLGDGGKLTTGWVIFSKDDPTKIIARCDSPFLVPELSWETSGQSPNVVFAEGLVQVENTWYLYYGAADNVVGLATAPVSYRSVLWSVEAPAGWEEGMRDNNISVDNVLGNISLVTSGIQGWWRLDEGTGTIASDSSGSGNDGTISGAQWTAGISDNALQFLRSDNNDYVNVGAKSSLEGFTDGLTISAWINPSSYPQNGEIVKKDLVYLLRVNTQENDSNVAFMVWDSNGVKHVDNVPDGIFALSSWSLITATWDGYNMRIYKNAVQVAGCDALFDNLATSSDNFFIGNDPVHQEGFDGSIDEVMVFSRALTDNDISYLYNHPGFQGGAQSGEWSSGWHDLGAPVRPENLSVIASVGAGENAWAAFEISKNGSSVEDNLGWLPLDNGSNTIDLSSLPDGRYAMVKFMLETDNIARSPSVQSFTLNGRELHINVATNSASFAGGTSVMLTGTLINLENEETQVWFEWRTKGAISWNETSKHVVSLRTLFSDSISGLTDNAVYEFRAVAEDMNSGENTTGQTLDFIMDRTPPAAFALISPKDNDVRPQDTPTTLTWEASSDNQSGLSHYEVWLNGINVDNVVENRYITAPLPKDNYTWYIVAVDFFGNVTRSENTLTFTTETAPEPFELISPQGAYTLENTMVLNWENSSSRVAAIDNYEVWINGVRSGEVSAKNTYYVTPALPQGSYQWYVVAVDQFGNYRQSDNTFTFNIGAPPPYPMRAYSDGFENNNLNGYITNGMGTTSNSLYGSYSLAWTGPGEGYTYVSNVQLLNFEGEVSVIFKLDNLNSHPGVGFASDDGSMVYALVDSQNGYLRIIRRGRDSAYGTVPLDYQKIKSPEPYLNWGTETKDDGFYVLDVQRYGISKLSINASYRLTLYFSTRSMCAMAFLDELDGFNLGQVRTSVDIAPDHPLIISDGPSRFDNFSFNVVDNWVYNWETSPTPVLSPTPNTWDAAGAFNPTVGIWDNKFRMFYRGNEQPAPPAGPAASSIGYATSSDGINWTKFRDNDNQLVPVLENGVDGGQSLEDPLLLINPFGDNVQYLAYTDYNGSSTPSKMRSFKFNPDGSILWQSGPWTINSESKITAIVDTSASPWGHPVVYNKTSYRFFSYMEPPSSMGFSNNLVNWVWENVKAMGRTDNTWSNNPDSTVAEVISGAMIMPDGNILVATCMTNSYGYVGSPDATVGTAIFSGSAPENLLYRAALPWAPVYYGDVATGAANLTKDNRSWYNGPNFPGKSFVLTSDNWVYFYYGGNDQYTGMARTQLAPEFEYRGLEVSKNIVDPKEPFVVSVIVRNVGNLDGPDNVKLYIDGQLENSKIVTLGRNNESTVQFSVTINEGGVYAVQAGDMVSTVLVVAPAVVSTTPENNSKGLVNQNVVVFFNKSLDNVEPLDQSTGTPVGYTFVGWSTTTVTNDTATWTHDNLWKENDNITLTVSGYKDLRGNVGDNYTWQFTTVQGAIATGPRGYSNTRTDNITYIFSGTPDNVKIYYTTDNGATWHLAGTDDTVDNKFEWTAPQDNFYWWAAVVPGVQTDPPTGSPDAGPLVIDTVPPSPPENIVAVPSGWKSTDNFTVRWTNPPDLSGENGAYYKLNSVPTADNDGTLVARENISSLENIKATMQGTNTVYVWLKDKAGNDNYLSFSSCTLRFDNGKPSAFDLISPENNARIQKIQDNTPPLTWENSSDNVSGIVHYEVWLNDNNVENVAENQYTSSGLTPQASYTWYVFAVDNAGNRRKSENSFTFILTVQDNTPPAAFDLISPENNAMVDTATPTLTWQPSSDNQSGLWHYEIWLDESNVDNVPFDSTSYTTELLSEGLHKWYVVAVDNAKNITRSDNIFNFTVGATSLINYVDPFIGTEYGHVSPGATVPFSMTSWDPVRKEDASGIDYPYQYDTTAIAGFRGSHFPSGSSASDYAPIVIMPESGSLVLGPDRASSFSHQSEVASPGYYAVTLDNYGIRAEVTSTVRAGIFKFTYSQAGVGNLLVDTSLGTGYEKVIPEDNEIVGYSSASNYKGPTGVFYGYFVVKIYNKSFSYGTWDQAVNNHPGQAEDNAYNSGAWVTFSVAAGETVIVKAAMSFISIDQARANLDSEIPDWNFDIVRSAAENTWENALGSIEVVGGSQDQKKIFYTALYHTMLSPRISSENGKYYSVFDAQVHTGDFYDGFSIWDTFRAEQSLLILTQPSSVVSGMAQSLVDMYEQGGWMPKWPDPGYSNLLIGTHGDSIIAETYLKGITGFDVENAYAASVKNATQTPPTFYEARTGINDYMSLGYAPADKGYIESCCLTLEYAYDDWCIAQLAKALGKDNDYNYYMNRATYYRNVFDNSVGFVRGRNSDGSWAGATFDPRGFYSYMTQPNEGDPWQYTFFAPQDVWGLMQLINGSENNPNYPDNFTTKLETLFQNSEEPGLIAENQYAEHGTVRYYWQGNEPGEHIPYLFDYAGEPWETQKWVDNIMKTRYRTYAYGLPGNDDCGQMSAWYVLSAMGFYPVEPPSLTYEIGRPIFDKVTIHLPNGNDFVIEAQNVSDENMYIQSATLNGRPLNKPWFEDSQLENGGELAFVMGQNPSDWGSYPSDAPPSMSGPNFVVENLKIFPPVIVQSENESVTISVNVANVGTAAGPKLLRLEVDGSVVDNKIVTLNPGQEDTIVFTISENELGVHTVYIEDLQGVFEVTATGTEFAVENLRISPQRVYLGENVTVSVDVVNVGENNGTKFLALKIDNTLEAIENITLEPGESGIVSFKVSRDVPGVYEVEIENLTGNFIVEVKPKTGFPLPVAIAGVAVIIVAFVGGYLLLGRRGASVSKRQVKRRKE
jgi:predicted alpha-1,2-mannosidase